MKIKSLINILTRRISGMEITEVDSLIHNAFIIKFLDYNIGLYVSFPLFTYDEIVMVLWDLKKNERIYNEKYGYYDEFRTKDVNMLIHEINRVKNIIKNDVENKFSWDSVDIENVNNIIRSIPGTKIISYHSFPSPCKFIIQFSNYNIGLYVSCETFAYQGFKMILWDFKKKSKNIR